MLEIRASYNTPLQRLLGAHLGSFEAQLNFADAHLPRHVTVALRRLSLCGDPATGFAWLRCDECDAHRLIAFRCGTRGLCPTCGGRRMVELSRRWVGGVFPHVGVRQWVLSLPWSLRYLLARRHDVCRGLTRVFLRSVFRFYQERGRALGLAAGQTGSVTVVQRFGSALNLNVHLHCLVLDGLFVKTDADEAPSFHSIPAPTTEQVQAVLVYATNRMERWLRRQGLDLDEEEIADEDAFAAQASASVAGRVALGVRAGRRVRRVRRVGGREVRLPERCAQVGGFNLHAGVVIGAHNRTGLERLCRYIARPPLASSRIQLQRDGLVVVGLKRAWSDGSRQLVFSPIELIEKLAALVPPPRVNQVLYHGVLAPRAKWRRQIVPRPAVRDPFKALHKCEDHRPRRHWLWADLLWHSFGVDGWACPNCGEHMSLRAVVIHPPATTRVLQGLGGRGPPDVDVELAKSGALG